MSDGQKHENDLDQVNAELAEQTGRPAPEYNLIAMTPSGRMLGAVTLAPGLTENVDDACGRVQRFFQAMNGVLGGVNVRPLTDFEAKRTADNLRGKLVIPPKPVIPKPNLDLGQVLVDVKNATDCCIMTLGNHCLKLTEIKPDAEVTCSGCGSTFRYVNDGEGNYAWLWMLPKKYVRPQREIFPLEQAFVAAKERILQREREDRWNQRVENENLGQVTSPDGRSIRVEYQAGYDPVTGEALKNLSFTGEAKPPMPPGARYLRIHEGSQVGDLFASGKLTPAAANLIESGSLTPVPPYVPPLVMKDLGGLAAGSSFDYESGSEPGARQVRDIHIEPEGLRSKTSLDGEGLPGEE